MSWITENFHKFIPKVTRYSIGGAIAVLYDIPMEEYPEINECACYATINVKEVELAPNEVIIKDYSENEGLYQCMLDAGHIGPEKRRIETGFVTAPVCDLLLPLPAAI